MTVSDWLLRAQDTLSRANILTARLDTLILLEDMTGRNRANLLADTESQLDAVQLNTLETAIKRRAGHEPLAYIRGRSEFYGREFYVDEHVLVPRPESETMITMLKKLAATTVIDVGTGSGALAVTAALELPLAKVIATDIDEACLVVARRNAQVLQATVDFKSGNLLQPCLGSLDNSVLLCNLPYVPDDFVINQAAQHEPRLALFAGADGLDLYRRLFEQLSQLSAKPSLLLTESLPQQHTSLAQLATVNGYQQINHTDFILAFTPAT